MNISQRWKRIWLALPTLYNVQPAADYRALISPSVRALETKAWARTGAGLRASIRQFDAKTADAERQHTV